VLSIGRVTSHADATGPPQPPERSPPAFVDNATLPLLEGYCHHYSIARGLAVSISNLPPDDMAARAKLLGMFDTATRAALAIARSLRITQQARITKGAAATAHNNAGGGLRKPWL
jgi:hypothetical protein